MTTFFSLILLLNLIVILFFKKFSILLNIFDKPINSHKTHKNNIPAIGGIILFINLFVLIIYLFLNSENITSNSIFFKNFEEFLSFFFVYTLFFITGVVDDKFDLNANIKLTLSIIYVLILTLIDPGIQIKSLIFESIPLIINLSHFKIIFTIFCFVTFINALNMFDGINLQVSLYSVFIIILFLLKINYDLLLVIVLFFLLFFSTLNYRSKCFLGDGGTLGLGFIFSYFFIKSYNINQVILCDEIFLIMLIPGLELLRLTISRIILKKNPFSADKNHLHHLLTNKFTLEKTLLITMLLIVFPVILNELIKETILIILFTSVIYFIIVFKLKKIILVKNFSK